jgi:hypothetical protein
VQKDGEGMKREKMVFAIQTGNGRLINGDVDSLTSFHAIEVPCKNDITQEVIRLYCDIRRKGLYPHIILLGPMEFLQWTASGYDEDRDLSNSDKLAGIPVYLQGEPGINFVYNEKDAPLLAWKLQQKEKKE